MRVVVPAEAAEPLYRQLELVHAEGKPLAVQDVALVMALATEAETTAVGAQPGGTSRRPRKMRAESMLIPALLAGR